jgi:LacI family transcriptional regulator
LAVSDVSRRKVASRQRITIIDVARKAGVSSSTVSNVLNGRFGAMTAQTLERVQAAIRELNYRPSNTARGLVTRRSATIGLILADIETPLFLQALSHIEPIARGAGYNMLLCNARNVTDEREALNLLLEKEVDGIIFLSTSQYLEDDHLQELHVAGMPVVLVNRATSYDVFDQVNWDNTAGVTAAIEHLVALGHSRIAFLHGPAQRRSSDERMRGYQAGLERCGLVWRPEYIQPGDFTGQPEAWRRSTLNLLALSPQPTAILAADDVVAAITMKTVLNAGLQVPGDIAVVGIDDQPFCTYLVPALSTVRLPVVEAGRTAVNMLLNRIAGRRTLVEHVLLPCPLIVRESCGGQGE